MGASLIKLLYLDHTSNCDSAILGKVIRELGMLTMIVSMCLNRWVSYLSGQTMVSCLVERIFLKL